MHKLLLALMASSAVTSGAFAAAHNPLVVWQGGATITKLSDGCGTTGSEVGDLLHAVFRPRLDPAEPESALSLISSRSASSFFQETGLNDQMHGSGTYSGTWVSGRVTNG